MELKDLPSNWNQITVEKFIELKKIEREDYYSLLSFKMEQLYQLTDTNEDDELWDETNSEDLESLFKTTNWLNKQPTTNFKKTIVLNSVEYHFKELKTLTLGEFIDLEYLFGINYITKLPEICAILYRQNKIDSWGHTIIEPRTYNNKERAELILELPITEVYGVLQVYLSYKKTFIDTFENLFEQAEISDEEDSDDHLEPISTIDQQKNEAKEKALKKWAWERVIHKLGGGNLLNFDKVTELPLILVFNHLSMVKELKLD